MNWAQPVLVARAARTLIPGKPLYYGISVYYFDRLFPPWKEGVNSACPYASKARWG